MGLFKYIYSGKILSEIFYIYSWGYPFLAPTKSGDLKMSTLFLIHNTLGTLKMGMYEKNRASCVNIWPRNESLM